MTGFKTLDLAHVAVRELYGLLDLAPSKFKALVEQGRRSGPSVALNIAEGGGRAGKDRFHHYRIAYGSSQETSAVLRLLRDLDAVPSERVTPVLELFDQVQAMTWRLSHGR